MFCLVEIGNVFGSVDTFHRDVGRVVEFLLSLGAVLGPGFEGPALPASTFLFDLGELFLVERTRRRFPFLFDLG